MTEIVRTAGVAGVVVVLLREAETQVALSVTSAMVTVVGVVMLYVTDPGTEPPI